MCKVYIYIFIINFFVLNIFTASPHTLVPKHMCYCLCLLIDKNTGKYCCLCDENALFMLLYYYYGQKEVIIMSCSLCTL